MKKTMRQMQKENTREKIIAAAYNEFVKRGILSTRMSDIAQAANVSHGTVFAHFENQNALTAQIIAEYGKRIALRTHTLSLGESSVREILKAHLAGIAAYEPFYTRLAIELRLLPGECRNEWISIQSAVSFHLSSALEQEMRSGKIKSAPVSFLFNLWTGLINYYLINSDLFAPEGKVMERYGEDLLNGFLDLISL